MRKGAAREVSKRAIFKKNFVTGFRLRPARDFWADRSDRYCPLPEPMSLITKFSKIGSKHARTVWP
jgi:hypothetical protein